MSILVKLSESRLLGDSLIRKGIKHRLKKQLEQSQRANIDDKRWIEELDQDVLAVETDSANEQHYEIPAEYFKTVLGPRLKYSCGYWENDDNTLAESEESMLSIYCQRAEIKDGMSILELGCGWGSLTLWLAEQYPNSAITAVSNSHSQRKHIMKQCQMRGLDNVTVITEDINNFTPPGLYDRIMSVEMFEHIRNHKTLLERIHKWIHPDGRLFVHIFAHKKHTYLFDSDNPKEWMSRYFFSGGIMPSQNLLEHAAQKFTLDQSWAVNGMHYSKTLEAWLKLQDKEESKIRTLFSNVYGKKAAETWIQRWRMFYMACSELFAYNNGNEWIVKHYLFSPR